MFEEYYAMRDKPSEVNGKVEQDRLYSIENIWVKNLGNNMISVGITDKFQSTTGLISFCWLSLPETVLKAGESFGSAEAAKMTLDFITPVSGKVLEMNQSLVDMPQSINSAPYAAWMLKIQMSKPEELEKLMSPEDYAQLQPAGCGDIPEISAEGLLRLIERHGE